MVRYIRFLSGLDLSEKALVEVDTALVKLWTSQIIELIQEFPEGSPCLLDLKSALAVTNLKEYFAEEVRA